MRLYDCRLKVAPRRLDLSKPDAPARIDSLRSRKNFGHRQFQVITRARIDEDELELVPEALGHEDLRPGQGEEKATEVGGQFPARGFDFENGNLLKAPFNVRKVVQIHGAGQLDNVERSPVYDFPLLGECNQEVLSLLSGGDGE